MTAVKGFSYMDHAPSPEPVDIRNGIADTLTMLGGKMRAKAVDVSVDLGDNLPRAHAVGAELNQVWMNLIDNALDAVGAGGHVTVRARSEGPSVVIRVIDDGPGIPDDIKRLVVPIFAHRIIVNSRFSTGMRRSDEAEAALQEIRKTISVPL